ncbi:HD-GYP domain-containing protein [Paenibacillus sp. EKM212P]|uniref:HD-GYP domain-containing protein n=1 Tax=Paenibacillus sp. EKM212P TaxID=1683680 RepID=UPI0013EE2001|nr:HD-GYP domain-containing protein [Paenibacillus sp. EKM212P]KAF6581326.1 HD-GYP domain-containing protein [Paenibacillus sp. EKM212P]
MRVHVTDAKPGDRLKSDTYNGHGVPVMIQGTELQHDDISKLIMHGVDYIDIDAGSASIPVDFAPDVPASPESLKRAVPLMEQTISGFESMFLEASSTGKFDEYRVDELFGPLVSELARQKDVVSLLLIMERGDHYTYNHSLQVGVLSYYIATWLGYTEEVAYAAGKAGYLHDIGKSMIPDEILNKPDKLTPEEFHEMKKHSLYGYDIIRNSTSDEISAIVALQHHEREDGSGYPHGLFKEDIHPFASITAIADVYSAMISNRVYQTKQELLTVLRELHSMSFGHLNPEATQVFIRHMLPNFINKQVLLTTGQTGTIILNNPADYFRPLVRINDDEYVDLSRERHVSIDEIYLES